MIYSISTTISFKIFDPDEHLVSGTSSPNSYTWYNNISIPGSFSNNNSSRIGGFGINCPSCLTGKYKVEIWTNDVMIGDSYFDVSEY